MDWKELADQFSLESESLHLKGRKSHLADGIVISLESGPALRAFAIANPQFEQQTELSYSRGRDLFSSFQRDHVTAECYWRLPEPDNPTTLFQSPSGFQLETIVSLRSSKLSVERIQLAMTVGSLISDSLSITDVDHGFVAPENGFSWCVLSHPDDTKEVTIKSNSEQVEIDVDVPWLERGVIRRIRLLLVCWSTKPQPNHLETVSKQFANSDVPLTT